MSEVVKDGGPAFLEVATHYDESGMMRVESYGGMTLRDWFAGMAIMGKADHQGCHPGFIEDAYRIADAMIKARQNG